MATSQGSDRPALRARWQRQRRSFEQRTRSAWLRTLHWFIPREVTEDARELLRARATVGVLLAFQATLVASAIGVALWMDLEPPGIRATITIYLTLAMSGALGLYLVRERAAVSAASTASVCAIFVVIAGACAGSGGFRSPSIPALMGLPVIAGFLSGPASGVRWAAAVVALLAGFSVLESGGVVFPDWSEPEHYSQILMVNVVSAVAITTAVIALYERMNERLREDLALERRRFEHLAGHDGLTGLPNRRRFVETLMMAIQRASRSDRKVCVMLLDLDRFKPINDAWGHAAGDRVLQCIGQRLIATLRRTDHCARLGGDEFAVILEALDDPKSVDGVVAKIEAAIARPLRIDGVDGCVFNVRASVGVVLHPDDAEDVRELLALADRRMYENKQRRRSEAGWP